MKALTCLCSIRILCTVSVSALFFFSSEIVCVHSRMPKNNHRCCYAAKKKKKIFAKAERHIYKLSGILHLNVLLLYFYPQWILFESYKFATLFQVNSKSIALSCWFKKKCSLLRFIINKFIFKRKIWPMNTIRKIFVILFH